MSQPTETIERASAEQHGRSTSRASFLMLWTAAVFATATAFIVHLSIRYQTVNLGYEVGAARAEQRELVEECRLLRLEAASLRSAPRVEMIARGTLEMQLPEAEQIVVTQDAETERRATAGRVQ